MVHNTGVIHDILLPGIASDVVKDHQLISEQIIAEHKAAAYAQYKKQKAQCLHIGAFTKSGQLTGCPDS